MKSWKGRSDQERREHGYLEMRENTKQRLIKRLSTARSAAAS